MAPPPPPKGKHALTIYFDTKTGLENFLSWYSNSGEQDSNYYSEKEGKDWLYVKPPDDACPECEFATDDINQFFYDNRKLRTKLWKCTNCGCEYEVKSIYMKDGT